MTADPLHFHRFPTLPPELRLLIWRAALPARDGPVLLPYKFGCWQPRWLSESDEGYEPEVRDNIELEMRQDLLDHTQVHMPLAHVNREARRIALAWVREQGIETRFCEHLQSRVFSRPFDPDLDTLYLAPGSLERFFCEPADRIFEPDLFGRGVTNGRSVTRLAVPEAVLRAEDAPLTELFEWYGSVEVLYVLVGAEPDWKGDDVSVRRRWELCDEGSSLVWGMRAFNNLAWKVRRPERSDALCELIETTAEAILREQPGWRIRDFEVRPVSAVGR